MTQSAPPDPGSDHFPDRIERFLDLIEQTSYEALPEDAVAAAKVFLLDTAGVALAGRMAPRLEELQGLATNWDGLSTGGVPIWNTQAQGSAPTAALINGYQCHALEYDCVYEPAVILPTPPILAALHTKAIELTAAGRPPDGKALIRAFVLALEVSCTIAGGARNSMFFFRPTTTGVFSALTAIACLDPLPRDKLRYAFGIGYSQMCGTMQAHEEGSMMLAMQMGFAARNAVQAHAMAKVGVSGPVQVLDGRFGYYQNFESSDHLDDMLAQLGSPWKVTQLSHKPFPSGRVTHGVIHTLRKMRQALDLSASASFDTITAMRVEMPPLGFRLTGRPMVHRPTPNYARLCIPFVAAAELLLGRVDPTTFVPEFLHDERIENLARRVQTIEVPHDNPNAFYPQTIAIEFSDRETLKYEIPIAWGHPDMPLSEADRVAKFELCCQLAANSGTTQSVDAQAFAQWIQQLDEAKDLAPLLNLLQA